ncbi:MAG: flagellar hook protein FlgE [Geminicoccaceae bacterium]
MSLFGSLFSGVSGLTAQSRSMSMISDNIANVNTTAYKGAKAQFASLVTQAGGSTTYNPGGVRSITEYTIESQGLVQASDSSTDVAISGDGFFVVSGDTDGTGEQVYTRDGAFTPDFFGNLRNPSGYYLQGWVLNGSGEVANVNQLTTVNVRSISGVAAATTDAAIGANLSADEPAFTGTYDGAPTATADNMAQYGATGGASGVQPDFARTLQLFDSLGRPHNVTVAFLKSPTTNVWNVELYADPSEITVASHPNGLLAAGTVTFNGDGTLNAFSITPNYPTGAAANAPIGIDWLATDGAADSSVSIDWGTIGETDGLTQFSGDTSVSFVTQNGAEVGQLNGVSIDEEGFVNASFTNGEQRKLFLLPVATFANPAALDPRSGNVYAQSDRSGAFNLRETGSGGAGAITPSALEAANVDLADEFTKMIVTQRAYSANARVISTTDDMLNELVRLGR